MEKYYTPHIDEFYVGFEYETLTTKVNIDDSLGEQEWIKLKFPDYSPNLLEITNYPNRVKYLDTNDIISLGFDLIGEGKELKIFRRIINEKHNPILVEIRLNYEGDFPIISIFEGNDILINSITCYNKSELKWMLNRLRII